MKKKIFSGFLAAVLAMSMTVTAFASNEVKDFTTGTNVDGSGTVLAVSDIYDVIVPTDVNYAINPAELSGEPQVMSGSFGVINHGSTAIKVGVTASIATGSSVTISDAETIEKINTATAASDVDDEALMYLAVAPVAKSANPTAEFVTTGSASYVAGTPAYAKVDFNVKTDIATKAAVAIPEDSASLAFKLSAANYEAKISGSAVTSGGGFDTSSVEAVQEYKGDFTDDPVAAFTIIGSVNKYADWNGITLPKVNLTFDLTKLNELQYNELAVNPNTKNMVKGDNYTILLHKDGTASYTFVNAPTVNNTGITALAGDGTDRMVAVNNNAARYSNGVLSFNAQAVTAWVSTASKITATINGKNYTFTVKEEEPCVIKVNTDGTASYTFVNAPTTDSTGITALASDGTDRMIAVTNSAATYSNGVLSFNAQAVTAWVGAASEVTATINGESFTFTIARDDFVIKIQADGSASYTFVNAPTTDSTGITALAGDGTDRMVAVNNNAARYSNGMLSFTAPAVTAWLGAATQVTATINGESFTFTVAH